jgi:hypothetical protein
LFVESELGCGSTFTFTIQAQAVAVPSLVVLERPYAGKSGLLVSQNPVNQLFLAQRLQACQVRLAVAVPDSPRWLSQLAAADLLFIDWNSQRLARSRAAGAHPANSASFAHHCPDPVGTAFTRQLEGDYGRCPAPQIEPTA